MQHQVVGIHEPPHQNKKQGQIMVETLGTDAAMLIQIWEELRHIRKRLDDHVDHEDDAMDSVRRDISAIREDMAMHKTKLGILSASISVAVAAVISWFVTFTR